jgi:hypothetical protein
MHRSEAMWMAFDCGPRPCAILVGTGGINALSGEPWEDRLRHEPQNYLVCPDQPWLDGFKTAHGTVRQFVAMPLGQGYTVGEQLSRTASRELHVVVYEARPGTTGPRSARPVTPAQPLGLAAGGKIRQKVYPDPYPKGAWDPERKGTATVVLLTAAEYREQTGREPPLSPIDAQTYARHGFPWFELYDADRGDLPGSAAFDRVKGIESGGRPLDISPADVKQIRRRPRKKAGRKK